VGSGADERLIKGCAFAGLGNYSFIYKDSEIEEKVIEHLGPDGRLAPTSSPKHSL
jgi:hypothetical protein